MRIAVVSLHRGGMAHYAAMLTRSIAAADPRGAVACFCCADVNAEFFAPHAERFLFDIPQHFHFREIGRLSAAAGRIRALRTALEDWAPDVIHLNSGHVGLLPFIPGLARRHPLVATIHDVRPHPGDRLILKAIKHRPLVRYARVILVHSDIHRQDAARRWPSAASRIDVIPSGLLLPPPNPPPAAPGPPDILFIGRLERYKGLDVLLRAWPAIAEACPEARLTIAGEGRLNPALDSPRARTGRIRIIRQYLSDQEFIRHMIESSVVVLPYVEASQSGVALAASAYGRAVVATRVGAIPDVVRDRETGLLVEPADPAGLAEAVIRLLRDDALRDRLGRHAATFVRERFGPETIGARLLDVYRRAAGFQPN